MCASGCHENRLWQTSAHALLRLSFRTGCMFVHLLNCPLRTSHSDIYGWYQILSWCCRRLTKVFQLAYKRSKKSFAKDHGYKVQATRPVGHLCRFILTDSLFMSKRGKKESDRRWWSMLTGIMNLLAGMLADILTFHVQSRLFRAIYF